MTAMLQPLSVLLLTALALMGSPGPATLSVMAMGAAFGSRRALPYLLGICGGTTIVLLAVASGLTGVVLAVPSLAPVLIALAAAYILYLAYKIATAPTLQRHDDMAEAPSFAGGLLLAVANPKAYAAIAAAFASARLIEGAPALDALLKTGVLVLMILLINSTWMTVGAALSSRFQDPRKARALNVGFAVALVATTILALI